MDMWELIAETRRTMEDYGVIWPSTYRQFLEDDLERLFRNFELDIEESAYDSGFSNGEEAGYDAGYADAERELI